MYGEFLLLMRQEGGKTEPRSKIWILQSELASRAGNLCTFLTFRYISYKFNYALKQHCIFGDSKPCAKSESEYTYSFLFHITSLVISSFSYPFLSIVGKK